MHAKMKTRETGKNVKKWRQGMHAKTLKHSTKIKARERGT